jgi:hypothetical protein
VQGRSQDLMIGWAKMLSGKIEFFQVILACSVCDGAHVFCYILNLHFNRLSNLIIAEVGFSVETTELFYY